VYIIGKFTVKPANKQYATVINDYELHFSDKWVGATGSACGYGSWDSWFGAPCGVCM